MKSILKNLEALKLSFFATLGALKMSNLVNYCLQRVQDCLKIKIQSLEMCEIGRFCTSRIPKIDFMENLSDRKMLKFPHCAEELTASVGQHIYVM